MIRAIEALLAGTIIAAGIVTAAVREADASPAFPDGVLTCAQAQHAAARASREVPRHYLADAVEAVCSGRETVTVVMLSRSFMDETYGRFAGLTMPVGFGAARQSGCVIFLTNRGDRWALLSHELSHCSGYRHEVHATAEVVR